MYSIEVSDLTKRFPHQTRDVLAQLSFALPSDESLCLLGPSGCGKTTLLRLLMGLEQPSGGEIRIAPSLSNRMAYMFQEPRLIPWRTSLENVLLPLELTQPSATDTRPRAIELLQRLDLGDHLQKFPRELSGGMQMRVALARALITQPKMLLLDEPFAALDERTRFRFQDLLLDLKATLTLQYIFVTHSIAEAVYLADRILLLDRHGRTNDIRPIHFEQRDQALKLSAEFNAVAKTYSQLFAQLEAQA